MSQTLDDNLHGAHLTHEEWLKVRVAAIQWARQVEHGDPGPEPLKSHIEKLIKSRVDAAMRFRGMDPAPEVEGEPYVHESDLGVDAGRVCMQRPDGSWWPVRYGSADPNKSGSTLCFMSHAKKEEK